MAKLVGRSKKLLKSYSEFSKSLFYWTLTLVLTLINVLIGWVLYFIYTLILLPTLLVLILTERIP